MCEKHDAPPPIFEERQGFFIVTFNATIAEAAEKTSKAPVTAPGPTQSPTQSDDPVRRLLSRLQGGELSSSQLREAMGIKHRPTFRRNYLHPALKAGLIEYTIPDKPRSSKQKYRLTDKGRLLLEQKER